MLQRKATEFLNNASPKNCGGQRTNKDRMRHTLHARITGETSNWEWWSYYGQSFQFKRGLLVGLCCSFLQLSRKDQTINNYTLPYLGYWAIHPSLDLHLSVWHENIALSTRLFRQLYLCQKGVGKTQHICGLSLLLKKYLQKMNDHTSQSRLTSDWHVIHPWILFGKGSCSQCNQPWQP